MGISLVRLRRTCRRIQFRTWTTRHGMACVADLLYHIVFHDEFNEKDAKDAFCAPLDEDECVSLLRVRDLLYFGVLLGSNGEDEIKSLDCGGTGDGLDNFCLSAFIRSCFAPWTRRCTTSPLLLCRKPTHPVRQKPALGFRLSSISAPFEERTSKTKEVDSELACNERLILRRLH